MKKEQILKQCFENVVWMAIRYAHGRHTYAPGMVRDAIAKFKAVCPDFELKQDITINPPDSLDNIALRSDYLDDLFQ